jgi:hypothetical protein
MALGLHGAMVVEIFPLRTRVTSMSFAYSATLALAGGSAPLVSAWLIDSLGHELAPAYYIMLLGAIGIALMWSAGDQRQRTRCLRHAGPRVSWGDADAPLWRLTGQETKMSDSDVGRLLSPIPRRCSESWQLT